MTPDQPPPLDEAAVRARHETEAITEWSNGVEEYIRSLTWNADTSAYTRLLVAGNIRAYAATVRDALAGERQAREAAERELREMEALRDLAREALQQYAQHKSGCSLVSIDDGPHCTCGLRQILAAPGGQGENDE